MNDEKAPTLEQIRTWPAAVSIELAARAFNVSRSHAYELARTGHFPAKTLKVGASVRVITASIIKALSGEE